MKKLKDKEKSGMVKRNDYEKVNQENTLTAQQKKINDNN